MENLIGHGQSAPPFRHPDAASADALLAQVHGDLQPSNVISTPEGEDLWIDLSDFGYGHPMLDLAMLYFLLRLLTGERAQHLFHLGLAELARIWDLFAEEYADARSPEEKRAFEQQVQPYAALHMIYLGVNMGFVPGMLDQAREIFAQSA